MDLYISYEDYTEDNYALKYNEGLAGEYLKYLNAMAETFHLENDVLVSTLSRYPDVFVMEEQEMDEEELWNGLKRQSAEHVNNSLRPVSGKART